MNHRVESMKADMHKDPRELEHEADQARNHMEHTLDVLQRRLSPGELLDQVIRTIRQNGGDFGSNLATQVRNNPLPTLLTSAGLTWLIAASSRPPEHDYEYGYGEGSSAGRSVRDRASSAAASAHEKADHLRDAAYRTRSRLSHGSRRSAESVRDGYEYLLHEQPILLGALAVATGAAIGALLPATETEDRLMGETRDETVERLKREGERRTEQAKTAAADVAESAAGAAQRKSRSETDSASPYASGDGSS